MSHGIFLYGLAIQRKRLALEWMVFMGFLNIIGACFYASRVSVCLQNQGSPKLINLSYLKDGFQIVSTL